MISLYSWFDSESETTVKPKIPPKPVMSAEAAAYPKLSKIYRELKQQNEIIFEAERERNALELECDDLKGIARFTKNGELQSKIDRKNEEIGLLKVGLSGIVKRRLQDYQRANAERQAEQTSKNKGRGAR